MHRVLPTIFVFLLMVCSCLPSLAEEITTESRNPDGKKPFVVKLAPDFETFILAGNINPANTTYAWSIDVEPTTAKKPPVKDEPFIKFPITPEGTKFTISVVKTVAGNATRFDPITVTVGLSAAIGDLNAAEAPDIGSRIKADLTALQKTTPKISAVCREIAASIETGIENATDGRSLADLVKKNVKRTLKETKSIESDEVRTAWGVAYDKLIKDLEKAGDTLEARKSKYKTGAEGLVAFANAIDLARAQSSPAAIVSSDNSSDQIAQRIAEALNDPPLELIKFDTEFQKTVKLLIAAIEDLMSKTDVKTASVIDYQEQTKKAVIEVLGRVDVNGSGKIQQSKDVVKRWTDGYMMFVSEVEKGDTFDTTTAQGWNDALLVLVVGLKRAAGYKDSIVEAAKRNQGRRTAASTAGGGGSAAGGSSGYGNTWHGVITARKVQHIRNRAAISRARIQRISGR